MNSQQYIKLAERIQQLERHYISESCDAYDVLDESSEEQQDDIRSFILLSHAEIEYYFEETAYKLCEEVNRKIQNRQYSDVSIWFIYHAAQRKDAERHNSPRLISDASTGYFHFYKDSVLDHNNGIKDVNIQRLFSPFIDTDSQVDSDLLAELNTLGTKRGECAHKGSLGIANTYNTSETRALINNIVRGLRDFDALINQLINE